nr:oligosaccharide flippase family protein [Amphibacillus cookii]
MLIISGTAFAQVLSILTSPIITRIYPPNEYGVLSVYISVLTILSISSSLDYQKAIPIAKDDSSAVNLLTISLAVLLIFTLSLLVVLFLWGEYLISLLNSEVLIKYMYFIPLGVLFLGLHNIVLQWSLRIKEFKIITITHIIRSITSAIGKISLGLIGFGPSGLILGHIVGQSGGITRLSSPLIKKRKVFIHAIKIREMKKLAVRYVKFPLYSAPSNYIYTAGVQAPIIILTAFFDTAIAGFYGLANSIVNLPISLLAKSVSQVFYSEVASIGKSNPKKIKKLSLSLSIKLALIGLVPLLAFVIFGPWLFSIVYGDNWYTAGEYARILSFVAYAHFIILPIGRILEVIEKQNIGLIINITRLIMIVAVFVVAYSLNLKPFYTLTIFAIISTLSYVSLFAIIQIILKREIKVRDKHIE